MIVSASAGSFNAEGRRNRTGRAADGVERLPAELIADRDDDGPDWGRADALPTWNG